MLIGGFQRVSFIDFPGKVCSIIFTVGCNFRCPYCHNYRLVLEEEIKNLSLIPVDEVFRYLEKRKRKINAVEFTGGEPTLQSDILEIMNRIKQLGLAIKLDTNGTNPNILEKAIEEDLVDYIAMDIKAPLERYSELTGVNVDIGLIQESIEIIKHSTIEYEFRTTAYPLLGMEDFVKIGELIKGAKKYVIQQFNSVDTLIKDPPKPYPKKKLYEFAKVIKPYVKFVTVRAY